MLILKKIPLKKLQTLYLTGLFLISWTVYLLAYYLAIPSGLEGKYYANPNWQGEPQLITVDSEISTAVLNKRRRAFSENKFSVEWKGFIWIEKPGSYTFMTASDDGSDLFVNNRRVVDNGGLHGLKEVKGQINLEPGVYPIHIRYFQAGGFYRMDVFWALGDQPLEKIPSSVLSPYPFNNRDYKLRQGFHRGKEFLKWTWLGILGSFSGLYLFKRSLQGTLWPQQPWKYYLLSSLPVIITTFLIYPFVDPTKAVYFNSDSAIVLNMIVENTPLAENIYYWGQARRGNLICWLAKIYFGLLGTTGLLPFITLLLAFSITLGFSVPLFLEDPGRKWKFFFLPLGFIFLIPTFIPIPDIHTLEYATLDIAFAPEYLFLLSMTILLALRKFIHSSKGFLPLMVFSALASWINDLTILFLAILAVAFTMVDFFVNKKIRMWYWWNGGISLGGVSLLKNLSPYHAEYLGFATWNQVRPYLGEAVYNLYHFLPLSVWLSIGILHMFFFLLWFYIWFRYRINDAISIFYFFLWLSLLILGVSGLIIPLFNGWFYANLAHPRYFVTGIQLLFLASSVSILAVWRIFLIGQRKILFSLCTTGILLALFTTLGKGNHLLKERKEEMFLSTSLTFQSGEVLSNSGCEAVIGTYLNSYVYVLGGLGKMKATVFEGDLDRSLSNTRNVLNLKNICVVGDTISDFEPFYSLKDKILIDRVDPEGPVRLPDGKFFKHYVTVDKITYLSLNPVTVEEIVLGDKSASIYLLNGFSGPEGKEDNRSRWSDGMESELIVPLQENRPYKVLITAFPFRISNKVQTLEIYLNGSRVDTVVLDSPVYKDYEVVFPAEKVKALNKIKFTYAYGISPNIYGEMRKLGVNFKRIRFIRYEDTKPSHEGSPL
ncbi:MAG TPA: PA14 domain-containing protein [Candidatus Limnocylindrales bacterium]|nr:PA14 domain-containing protein [Candidatus Limnocylindrales bacterium]